MANDDDFTFCPIGVPEDKDSADAQKVVKNISEIKIEDESLNGGDTDWANCVLLKDKLPSNANSRKEETVRSLSFSVINTSSSKPVNQQVSQREVENAGSSAKASQGKKTPARKAVPQTKVPFEKGYSQMDWMKLTRAHPDLAGLNGQSNRRLVSMNEVKQHQTEGSMWTVLKGRVYNIAPYMKFHPGGRCKCLYYFFDIITNDTFWSVLRLHFDGFCLYIHSILMWFSKTSFSIAFCLFN